MSELAKAVNAKDGSSFREIVHHYGSKQYSKQACEIILTSPDKLDPWQHLLLLIACYTCLMDGNFSKRGVQEVIQSWNMQSTYDKAYWKIAKESEPKALQWKKRRSMHA